MTNGMQTAAGALDGLVVLDLTRMVAGPLCTQHLADLGATVIKIERPGEGDDSRRLGPFLRDSDGTDSDDSVYYLAYNRGKQSVTVDIASPRGAALVRALARQSDIVVENFKPGSLRRYGLSYDDVRRERPDIVYCSITGFGPDGPYAPRPAYDSITQGMAGLMSTNGHPEGEPGAGPLRTAAAITDVSTGLHACIAILAALRHRDLTGEGQCIDVALFDVSVAMNGHLATEYLSAGSVPRAAGNANPSSAPSEMFRCADGALMIAAGNNAQFTAFCTVLGLPELARDPRFATNMARRDRRGELHALLEARTATLRCDQMIERLVAAGVPCGRVLDLAQVFDDPQVRHRDLAIELAHPRSGTCRLVRNPLRFERSALRHERPPMLGEHTETALRGRLGLTAAELDSLREAGVIGHRRAAS